MIVGLSAKIGCGKTTLAQMLLERLPGWERVAFADCLKEEASRVFGYPLEWNYSEAGKAIKVPVLPYPSDQEWEGMTVRELLQWYGTDVCRAQDPGYWVKRMRERIAGLEHVLIDDVRFRDEADLVRELGGMLIRLEPFPGWKPGPHAGHRSETALDTYLEWDLILQPVYGGLEEMVQPVLDAMNPRKAG